MTGQSRHVQRVYLILMLLHTLAASFIWAINKLFLLVVSLYRPRFRGSRFP